MKIKNKKILYILLIIFISGNISCNKILDIPPQGKLTSDQYWKSRDQAIAAIAGIYQGFGTTNTTLTGGGTLSQTNMSPIESYVEWGDMRGDLLTVAAGQLPATATDNETAKENVDNFTMTALDETTKYTNFYKLIDQANLAIKYIPSVPALDPSLSTTEANQLIGEAYFLRAYAYFWLVRTFKDVPMILVPSETDAQDYNIPKSSSDVVCAQIIQDLTIARNTLPEWYTNTAYPRCRATIYSAMTVLSDVELWVAATTKNTANNNALYDKVIINCDSVINSGRFLLLAGVSLNNIFAGNSFEAIFESYANGSLNQSNAINSWFLKYYLFPSALTGLFSPGDFRGTAPPSGTLYIDQKGFINKYNPAGGNSRWEFYRLPDVMLMKAEALAHRYPDDVPHLQIACDLINQIRQRAFVTATNAIYQKVTPSTTVNMDNALLDERGREFYGEGKRWFDLVRFASRDNIAHPEFLTQRVISSFDAVTQLIIAPRIQNPDGWYMPLNQVAIDSSNGKLIQNPYYQQ
ncbi:MAG TPA: RagB/SusD family nutrient uptake outer membrane protein [Mucilaginibacter sp.]|jgi:hypothetical protein|nr:RagB/SusD family nutrient uptake outer membrane protein [Mucilaginibacter sp.]